MKFVLCIHDDLFNLIFLFFKRNSVYRVALKQSRGSSRVVTHRTADVRVTSDRPVTLGLVPVELSTSIYDSHAVTYLLNTYVSQIRVYLR